MVLGANVTLCLLLLILPFAALVSGCATLRTSWRSLAAIHAPFAMLIVAGTTLASGGALAVVALHMLAN